MLPTINQDNDPAPLPFARPPGPLAQLGIAAALALACPGVPDAEPRPAFAEVAGPSAPRRAPEGPPASIPRDDTTSPMFSQTAGLIAPRRAPEGGPSWTPSEPDRPTATYADAVAGRPTSTELPTTQIPTENSGRPAPSPVYPDLFPRPAPTPTTPPWTPFVPPEPPPPTPPAPATQIMTGPGVSDPLDWVWEDVRVLGVEVSHRALGVATSRASATVSAARRGVRIAATATHLGVRVTRS